MPTANLWILAAAQVFGACGTIVVVTFGGLVGSAIAPTPALATLPLASTVVGTAAIIVPATFLMSRFGRKRVFVGGAVVGAAAALLAAVAIVNRQFGLFCGAAFLIGAAQAVVMQYRFAATEYAPRDGAARAVGLVMFGTLVAAVIGPELADRVRLVGAWPEFAGSFVALAALLGLGGVLLVWLRDPPAVTIAAGGQQRPLRVVAAQPAFILAVLAGVGGFGVMSFVMTATPISMHVHDGLSVTATRQVITAHLVAMYAPSLVSGWLVRALGLTRMLNIGALALVVSIGIAVGAERDFGHYMTTLVLLGLGWNFLFVAGTTLLTQTYSPAERFKAQGLNDFVIFAAQALVSLLAGTAIDALGWAGLNLAAVPLVMIASAAIVWFVARERVPAQRTNR